MITFFDTETNGLPADYNSHYSTPNAWPDLLQLAFVQCNDSGDILNKVNMYIRQPSDFVMNAEAQAVHNIQQEQLDSGYDKEVALEVFAQAINDSNLLVAHNMDFDRSIILANYYQLHMAEMPAITNALQLCTMKSASIKAYFKAVKWMRLSAMYKKLFVRDFADAHNAMNDVIALKECYFELARKGVHL